MTTYNRQGLYSVRSLANELIGETGNAYNATGNAPDRMLNLVAAALREVWEWQDWYWQRVLGTLSITAGDTEEAMPADFRKIDSKWIRDCETSSSAAQAYEGLIFTDDLSIFQQVSDDFDDDDTGEPVIACIVQDTSETAYMKFKALITPKADQDYDYTYPYVTACPLDLEYAATTNKRDTEQILMPTMFHEGWRQRARLKVLPAFGKGDSDALRKEWNAWLAEAIAEQNGRITNPIAVTRDAYGDMDAIPRIGYGSDINLRRVRGR